MKSTITRKDINFYYDNVLVCNEIQNLLSYENARFYNCGVYGWNWDAYTFGNTVILTGYRNFTGCRVSYSLQKEYSDKAKVIKDSNADYDTIKEQLRSLIYDFIEKAIEE